MFLCGEGLSAGYGSVPVISNVSIDIALGEVVCLIGPNGAGKSTLLKALTGILKPIEGRVVLNGEDVAGLPTEQLAGKGLAYVPQVNDVFDTLTVAENLQMGGYLLSKKELGKRTDEVLESFPPLKTLYKRIAGSLSGGERKLLAIARALMLETSLLVLDEPTASLSPQASHDILEKHVRSLADRGTAILLVEQKVEAALKISDRAFVLVAGQIQLTGSGQELLARDDLGQVFLQGATSR